MQKQAIERQQAESAFNERHARMEEALGETLSSYVVGAVASLEIHGITFSDIRPAMAKAQEDGARYGLGPGSVSLLHENRIGILNHYVIFVLPSGVGRPLELKGNMYWDFLSPHCEYWVDFVGKFDCGDFVSGKSKHQFTSAFRESVRQGFTGQ